MRWSVDFLLAEVLPAYPQELDRATGLRDESLVTGNRSWLVLQSFRAVPFVTRERDQIMPDNPAEGFAWQLRVWDQMADVYQREIDTRFLPVIEQVLKRAALRPGETILDLGTGTGAVAILATTQVGTTGRIKAVDISPEMLAKARVLAQHLQLTNIDLAEGRAEAIPAADRSVDAVLASLSLMYVIDRATAAKEIARVLRPGGRFVAAVWGGPSETDIVKFQQTAGGFAPAPPVQGVGPGALADPSEFLSQLQAAGLDAKCEKVTTTFEFAKFQDAWDALAGVTAAALEPKTQEEAKAAVRKLMWPNELLPRTFRNSTQLIYAKAS
jgi:SAM-dependent methyltransferase